VIHENAPHDPSRNRDEVRTILPRPLRFVDQPQIRLVHECRGFQCVVGPFVSHLTTRQAAEFVIDQRSEVRGSVGPTVLEVG